MAWTDDFTDEMNTTITIYGKGAITGKGADGQPTYATDVTKYSGVCAFYQLSANEVYAYDRIGNPSTHGVIIDPAKITATINPSDWAVINGETYDIFTPTDVLQLGDVTSFTVRIRK